MMSNHDSARLSILWQRICLLLSAWLLTGCMTSGLKCIQADGEWDHDSYDFGGGEIKRDEPIDHFVTLDCRGAYSLLIAIEPEGRFITGPSIRGPAFMEGKYYEEVRLADGTAKEKFLQPHRIRYTIEVSSLDKPGKVVFAREKMILHPYPGVFIPAWRLKIPKDFSSGEKLRIRMLMSAEDDFYRDYGLLKIVLLKDWSLH